MRVRFRPLPLDPSLHASAMGGGAAGGWEQQPVAEAWEAELELYMPQTCPVLEEFAGGRSSMPPATSMPRGILNWIVLGSSELLEVDAGKLFTTAACREAYEVGYPKP